MSNGLQRIRNAKLIVKHSDIFTVNVNEQLYNTNDKL